MFESLSSVIAMVLVGGIRYPLVSAAFSLAYCIGNFFYLQGYADMKKDVKGARYSTPLAALKPIGMFGAFFTCVTACVNMLL